MRAQAAPSRREMLRHGLAIAGCLAGAGLLPTAACAQSTWNAAAFGVHTLDQVLDALGASSPMPSDDVMLNIPDLADNGATVPVGLSTALPGAVRLALLVDKNPTLLIAVFDLTTAVDADVALRIKMAESSTVYAVAMFADGRVLYRAKDVQVTLGSCGV